MAKKFYVCLLILFLIFFAALMQKTWRKEKPISYPPPGSFRDILFPETITAKALKPPAHHFNINLWVNGHAVFAQTEHAVTDTIWGMRLCVPYNTLTTLVMGVMACNQQGDCVSDSGDCYRQGQDTTPGPNRDVADPQWYVLSDTTYLYFVNLKNDKDTEDFELPDTYQAWHWSPINKQPNQ